MWPVKPKQPVSVSAEALAAAETGPHAITDTQLIAQLRQHISSQDEVIARLRAELDERPSGLARHDCPGCAGLRKTLAEQDRAHAADRKLIMRLQLSSPEGRARTLPYVEQVVN